MRAVPRAVQPSGANGRSQRFLRDRLVLAVAFIADYFPGGEFSMA
jgi:hypothetical protein